MNEENPYEKSVLSVHCGYCGAPAGKHCVIKDTDERAVETHEYRYAQRISARRAWEEGRKSMRSEMQDQIGEALAHFGIVVTSAHLHNRLLERVDALKNENDALKAPITEAG